jgi:hypothetical protein
VLENGIYAPEHAEDSTKCIHVIVTKGRRTRGVIRETLRVS